MRSPVPPSHGHKHLIPLLLLIATLALAGCGESTAPDIWAPSPRYVPARTPEPTVGSFHVVLNTTGADPDPDGYVLTVDDTITRRVRIDDTVAIGNVVLGRHRLRLAEIATNCVLDSASSRSLFLTSARDTVAQFTIGCVGASTPPGLAGTQLLFVRDNQIYRTTVGSDAAPVLLGAGGEPTWSPDGQHIAFTRDGDVYVMDADGANPRLVAKGIPIQLIVAHVGDPDWESGWGIGIYVAWLRTAAWSPDGGRLAMYSDDGIVIAPAGGAAPVTLDVTGWQEHGLVAGALDIDESHGVLAGSPAWSPDGKHIAFVSDSLGGRLDLYVGDVDGSRLSNIRRLTDAATTPFLYLQPAWSPDGSRIAVVACPEVTGGEHPCTNTDIVVMNADGSQPRTLAHANGYARPAWAPDGQTIAFANTCPGYDCPSAVLYVSTDGTREGLLVDDAHSPSWHK